MFKKKSPELILLLLQRTQLSIFRAATGKIINLPLPDTVVQDLEIKDEKAFINSLKNFVVTQKINLGEVVIILDSSVYFSQPIVEQEKEASDVKQPATKDEATVSGTATKTTTTPSVAESFSEEQRKIFVQSMPFANVYSRIITIEKKKSIIALNRDLYEPIVKVFNDLKLEVTHIYPIVVLMGVFASEGFTPNSATRLLENREKYKIHNFLQLHTNEDEMITTVLPTENKDKKRVLLLVILFIILLGVLVAVWFWSQNSASNVGSPRRGPAQPSTGAVPAVPTPSPTVPTVVPVQTLEQLLTSTESAQLVVGIIDASGDSTTAGKLQAQLTEAGFTNVTIIEKTTQQTGAVSISGNSSLSPQFKEALLVKFQEWGYKVRFTEDESLTSDITVIVTSL